MAGYLRCQVLFTLLIHMIIKVRPSEIVFQSSTFEVKEGITKTLDLHCMLNDTTALHGIIGRRGSDQTVTTDNVAELTSVVIMLNGKDIATVTHSSPAHILDVTTNTRVTGSISGSTGEMTLSYQTPTHSQTGQFTCQINALSKSGHVVTLSTSVEVSLSQPSISDLMKTIMEMKSDEDQLKSTIKDMSSTIADLQKKTDTAVFFSAGVITNHLVVQHQQAVKYDAVFSNIGGGYDPNSGIFTCNTPGFYLFIINGLADGYNQFDLDMFKNGVVIPVSVYGNNQHSDQGSTISVILPLVKGDTIKVVSYGNSLLRPSYNMFSGQLIYPQ